MTASANLYSQRLLKGTSHYSTIKTDNYAISSSQMWPGCTIVFSATMALKPARSTFKERASISAQTSCQSYLVHPHHQQLYPKPYYLFWKIIQQYFERSQPTFNPVPAHLLIHSPDAAQLTPVAIPPNSFSTKPSRFRTNTHMVSQWTVCCIVGINLLQ